MFFDQLTVSKIVEIRDKLLQMESPCRLESGDPEFDIPTHVKSAFHDAVQDGFTHYTNSVGIPELRVAIAKKLKQFNNITADPRHIRVTNGGMHGLYCTQSSILDEGDEVLVPMPNWIGSNNIIKSCGGVVTPVKAQLKDGLFKIDVKELEANLSLKTKSILINSPHNPTGTIIDQNNLIDIVQFAHRHGLYIISDEAYEHLTYDGYNHISTASIVEALNLPTDKIVSVFSFSKSYAMSGLRLGYIVTTNEMLLDKMKKAILYTCNGINSITQKAGVAALEGPQECLEDMKRSYQEKRDLLQGTVEDLKNFSSEGSTGGFYLWVKVEQDSEKIADKLIQYGVGSIPGKYFGGEGNYLRFSYSCPKEHIQGACKMLTRLDQEMTH